MSPLFVMIKDEKTEEITRAIYIKLTHCFGILIKRNTMLTKMTIILI